MPSWIYIFSKNGGMGGLMGPYTEFRARQLADKLEAKHEIYRTATNDPVKAKRIIKEKLIENQGYEIGSKRISNTNPIAQENE